MPWSPYHLRCHNLIQNEKSFLRIQDTLVGYHWDQVWLELTRRHCCPSQSFSISYSEICSHQYRLRYGSRWWVWWICSAGVRHYRLPKDRTSPQVYAWTQVRSELCFGFQKDMHLLLQHYLESSWAKYCTCSSLHVFDISMPLNSWTHRPGHVFIELETEAFAQYVTCIPSQRRLSLVNSSKASQYLVGM